MAIKYILCRKIEVASGRFLAGGGRNGRFLYKTFHLFFGRIWAPVHRSKSPLHMPLSDLPVLSATNCLRQLRVGKRCGRLLMDLKGC